MIPGCKISGRSGTEVHFSHILRTFLRSFASVLVHAAGGGFRGSHARRVRLCLLQFRIFY